VSVCLLFLRGGKNLGGYALVDTVVELVVPDLAGGLRFALDPVLAGLVVGQRLGAGRNAAFADVRHSVDGFVVFFGLFYCVVLYCVVSCRTRCVDFVMTSIIIINNNIIISYLVVGKSNRIEFWWWQFRKWFE
jgi:hypothetical protein